MKKFISLVVLFCAVMISSTASAADLLADYFLTTRNYNICMIRLMDLQGYRPSSSKNAEQQRLKDEQARQEEQYRLVFTVTLTAGLIVLFFAYNYFQNRQLVRERSFASWLLSFAAMKNFWELIFCVVSLVTCVVYLPYNQISSDNPAVTIKTAHATIFDTPKNFNPRLTKIDYEAVAFREVLMLIACCAGYTVSTIMNKK